MTDKKQVLIVDDDPDFVEQMALMFSSRGYATKTASGRKQAETLFDGFTPEIAVIDLMMEHDDDGFVLAHKLKKKHPECAILMVTNVTRETGLEFPKVDDTTGWISADAIFSKPVRFEQLEEALKKMGKS
jgi:DNA-binding response OmpR family regulator